MASDRETDGTLGLRWELTFPETVNASGNGATLNLNDGLMYVFGVGGVSDHGIQTMNWHHFAPRVGVAYQINPKTVVRAGYGWSYDLGVFGSNFGHNVTQNPPVLSNQNLQSAERIQRRLHAGARSSCAGAGNGELERHVPAAAGNQPEVPAGHDYVAHGLPVQRRPPAPVDE